MELFKHNLFNDSALKFYARFEETSGTTVNDSSTGAHNGTASRSNILNNASGIYGNKAVFVAASSDVVTMADHSDFKPTGVFTAGFWINHATNSAYKMCFQAASKATNYAGWQIWVDDTGKVHYILMNNSGSNPTTNRKFYSGATNVCDSTWHFVVCVWDGTNMPIYVDGVQDATQAGWNCAYETNTYPRIGARTETTGFDAGTFLDGSLDEVFLFNGKALSVNQIADLYKFAMEGIFPGHRAAVQSQRFHRQYALNTY